ncbi:DUF4468 domain-containing protein [Spirosoma endophyticum]|uniref:DUF4468 domain-containing protein n=1 Tax=Spirosoma endophyticum TaxID=662367 RepID=A0A1I2HVK3_9BACT|nr:DUF4468 domain-containing protein [Spirosoma endophyticum]SFF32766.1 protein of unknown function [Spirosoma endophyticum]
MLKPLYFLVSLLLTLPVIAQKSVVQDDKLNGIIPLDSEGKPAYQVNNNVEGATKDELFKRARKWFVKTYNAPQDVLQVNDSSSGVLTGTGSQRTPVKYQGLDWQGNMEHTLSVKVKEGKYQISLTDLKVEGNPLQSYQLPNAAQNQAPYTALYRAIDQHNRSLIASLEKALATSTDF